MRVALPLEKAHRVINHGPVVLVSAAADGEDNVMAAAWCMALDFTPPKLAVVVAADTHTRALIMKSRELVVQVPPRALLDVVDGVGTCSGRDVDKWTRFGIGRARASRVGAPLVEGCTAWLECTLLPGEEGVLERHDLLLCAVVAAWVDDAVYDGGRLRAGLPPERRSLHHVAGGAYLVDGDVIHARRNDEAT